MGKAYLRIVRAVITFRQPAGFRIGNFTQFPNDATMNDTFFALNNANLKTGILRPCYDFVSVKSVESFRSILPLLRRDRAKYQRIERP